MTYTDTDKSTKSRRRRIEGRELVAKLRVDFPNDTPDETAKRFIERNRAAFLFEDKAQEAGVLDIVRDGVVANIKLKRKMRPRQEIQQAASKLKAGMATKLIEQVATGALAIRLLDFKMPDGKPLAEWTGAQCKRFGGFFFEVGKRLNPRDHVGQHLDEDELQSIARTYRVGAAQ